MYIEDAKFSLWCDFIERDFLSDGLNKLIDQKIVNGATSNPAIFKSAFLTSPAYKSDIEALQGKDAKEIYETLAIKDIQTSADLLQDLYLNEDDGFISIEVDPNLCDDAEGTIEEARRLHQAIGRENVMIKIPATKAGFEAMEILIAEGIHINATLIFSPAQALGCLDAFEKGSKQFAQKSNKALPEAVISIFVSRFDRKMDAPFFDKNIKGGLLGIFNANRIYNDITKRALPNVRALFASTGVKGDTYVPDYYITNLLFKNSVNTAPIDTIDAFVKTGIKESREPFTEAQVDDFFNVVENQGFDMEQVYDELMDEGLVAFKDAFKDILNELN
ncbi:MAG: transaldolase [Epsilonproteobacteria bacterium]|nr:transaldolase [Campylobacterota bacterium]